MVGNKHEVSEGKHNDQDHREEISHVSDGLNNQLDVLSICCKESKPIEDLNPHEEHAPGANIKNHVVREISLLEEKVDTKHHQKYVIQGD
jgi:hypothetical protein